MTTLVLLNAVVGTVYTSYGVITAIELRRGWRQLGPSPFGIAWIAMAFTCGPHHLDHALHLAVDGTGASGAELVALGVGLGPGLVWFLLRLEAFAGGPGDRSIVGTPSWLRAATVAVVAAGTLGLGWVGTSLAGVDSTRRLERATPNLLLVGLYVVIGFYLGRTQVANRPASGGWSLSGVALTAVFPTCALMHLAFAATVMAGVTDPDNHVLVLDWLAVPAAVYFLSVVRSLYSGRARDWNESAPRVLVAVT